MRIGNIDARGQAVFDDAQNAASAPAISFDTDTNTGIYRPAADQMAMATGGVQRLLISDTAFTFATPMLGADGSATAPTYSFSSDSGNGVYLSATDTVGIAAGGANVAAFASTGLTLPSNADIFLSGGGEVLGLPATPSGDTAAASKAYVDNISSGLDFKDSVHMCTVSNLSSTYNNGTAGLGATLTGSPAGVLPADVTDNHARYVVGTRLLVKSQTDATENGLYEITDIGSGEEITEITTVADVADSLSGTYWTFNDATTSYYVWYDTGSSTDPAPGGTGIQVVISTGALAAIVTANTINAINASGAAVTAYIDTNTFFYVVDDATGTRTDAADVDTGFTVAVTSQGTASPTAWVLTRTTDADNSPTNEVSGGMFTFVEDGDTCGSTSWIMTEPEGQAVLGTDDLVFSQFSGSGAFTAGIGLGQAGTQFFFDPDNLVNTAVVAADEVAFHDVSYTDTTGDNGARKRTWSAVTTDLALLTQVGGSNPITASDGVSVTNAGTSVDIELDITNLGAATIVGADELVFDDGATGNHAKTTVTNFLADLDIVNNLGGNGIAVQTAADTYTARSIAVSGAGDADGLSVTNGDGVSGNPTLGLDIVGTPLAAENVASGDLFILNNDSASANEAFTLAEVANGVSASLSLAYFNTVSGDSGTATADVVNDALNLLGATSGGITTTASDTPENVTFGLTPVDLATGSATLATGDFIIVSDSTDGATTLAQKYTFLDVVQDLDIPYGISSNGFLTRTADDTYAQRSIAVQGAGNQAGLAISDGAGASGNPTVGLDILNTAAAGANLAAGDLLAVYDLSNTANRRMTGQELADGVASLISADTTIITDADGDTFVDTEASADEDIIRFSTGETPAGYGAVANIMTLASSGLTLAMGTADTATTAGAPVSMTAGTGNTTGAGGDFTITAGDGGTSSGGDGGLVVVNGGDAGTSSAGDGGDIELRPGAADGAGTDGVVKVIGATSGTAGAIRLEDNAGGEYIELQAAGTISSSFTLTLPNSDSTGTQALVSNGSGTLSWQDAAATAFTSVTGDSGTATADTASDTLQLQGATNGGITTTASDGPELVTFGVTGADLATSVATIALADTMIVNDSADTASTVSQKITFTKMFADLDVPNAITSNGLVTRTSDNNYASRTIAVSGAGASDGLEITNGDGVSGNPTLGLDIDGSPAAGEDLATGDLFLLYNSSASANESFTVAEVAAGLNGTQTLLQDADSNTKVDVEEGADDNTIRMDVGPQGSADAITDVFVLNADGLTVAFGTNTSGDGGDIDMTAGTSSSGSGGDINLTAGVASAGEGSQNGEVTITGGATTTAIPAGDVNIVGGDSTAGGVAGDVVLTGGTASSSASKGGDINIDGGPGTSTGGDGGEVYIDGGYADSGDGGSIVIEGGAGSGAGFPTPQTWAGQNGGDVTIRGGEGFASGGDVTIQGGATPAGSGSAPGGNVNIVGGNSTVEGQGGIITLTPGLGADSVSDNGYVLIDSSATAAAPELRLEDDAGDQYIGMKAAGTTTSYTMTWPAAVAASSGQVLSSDTSGNLSWTTISGNAYSTVNGDTGSASATGASTLALIGSTNGGIVTVASEPGTDQVTFTLDINDLSTATPVGTDELAFNDVSDTNTTRSATIDAIGAVIVANNLAVSIADADGDTAVKVEESADEDIIRFDTGETPVGYGAVGDIMTLASSGWTVAMGTATAATTAGAPISLTAGTGNTTGVGGNASLTAGDGGTGAGGGDVVMTAGDAGTGSNADGGDIELRPGALDGSGADGTVRIIGPTSGTAGQIRLEDNTGGEYIGLQAAGTISSSFTLTLPTSDSTGTQALVSNGSGTLSWQDAAALAFSTIAADTGSNTVADSAADTLSLIGATNGGVATVSVPASDQITFELDFADLTALGAAPATGDLLAVADISATNAMRSITVSQLASAVSGASELGDLSDVDTTAEAAGFALIFDNAAGTWEAKKIYHVENFTSQTSVTVTHNLNNQYPVVTVFDGSDQMVIPATVTATSTTQTTVTFAVSTSGNIVLMAPEVA